MGDGPDWERALSTLGKDFHITRMTFKNHGCCGHTFAAIDGALVLKDKMKFSIPEIEKISVGTYKAALDVAGYEEPRTASEARFSLKYVVATALAEGSVRLSAFDKKHLASGRTRDLMKKISVAIDPELDAAFPARRAARVAITAGGRREEFLQPTRKGDPEMPLSDRELEAKFLELAAPVAGKASAKKLLERLWRLETEKRLP
jgi:2-methylcitrate dehydratase PrpD